MMFYVKKSKINKLKNSVVYRRIYRPIKKYTLIHFENYISKKIDRIINEEKSEKLIKNVKKT